MIKKPVLFALATATLTLIMSTSCENPPFGVQYMTPDLPTDQARPIGSVVISMNGNVVLNFPYGAVAEAVKINVNQCVNIDDSDILLKMISIEPLMLFKSPVTVKMRYDGELLNGEMTTDNNNLTVKCWEREVDYINGNLGNLLSYSVDTTSRTIYFQTVQTGIFAVDLKNKPAVNPEINTNTLSKNK